MFPMHKVMIGYILWDKKKKCFDKTQNSSQINYLLTNNTSVFRLRKLRGKTRLLVSEKIPVIGLNVSLDLDQCSAEEIVVLTLTYVFIMCNLLTDFCQCFLFIEKNLIKSSQSVICCHRLLLQENNRIRL